VIHHVSVSMDIIKLTQDRINVDELTESVSSPKCGAISLFIGTTRDNFENKKVCISAAVVNKHLRNIRVLYHLFAYICR